MKNISIKWNDEMQLNQYEIKDCLKIFGELLPNPYSEVGVKGFKDIVPMRYVESADKNG